MATRVPKILTICNLSFLISSLIAVPVQAQSADQQNQFTIILPLELIAGRPATIAVLAANGHIAPRTKVVLSNGELVTTDESGRAHFLVPSQTVVFARIPGTGVREAADVLPQAASDTGLQVTQIPTMVSTENHFAISGHGFYGDADRNRITMDGKAAFILASSPVQLIVMSATGLPPGRTSLRLTEGLAESVITVTLVGITSVNSAAPQIHRGRKAQIILLARGTDELLTLKVQNLSPQTVQLAQGTEAYVRTTGGPDNSAILQVKGKTAGSFSFAISLESTTKEANLPVVRDFLGAAQKEAMPDIGSRIGEILTRLQAKKIDIAKLRHEIQQLQTQSGSRDFQALIRASLRALNGE